MSDEYSYDNTGEVQPEHQSHHREDEELISYTIWEHHRTSGMLQTDTGTASNKPIDLVADVTCPGASCGPETTITMGN